MRSMSVSDFVANFLVLKKVELAFVITGSGSIRLIQSLSEAGIRYVCPHHEQAAVMAALTYMRVSKKPAVVIVTGGPGASNTFTGLADAFLDSLPLLIIAGQENLEFMSSNNQLRGKGVQGLDMVSATKEITKFSHCVKDPNSISWVLEKAFHEAHVGRPGPVWIEIPQNLQSVVVNSSIQVPYITQSIQKPDLKHKILDIIALIKNSQRPLLLVGHGVRLSNSELIFKEVISKLKIPILASWQAADLMPNDHPLFVGRAGVYGQRFANLSLQNCDLLITLGSRLAIPQRGFSDEYFARAAKKVIIEIDPTEIAKFKFTIDIAIEADVHDFLNQFNNFLKSNEITMEWNEWKKTIKGWQSKFPMSIPPKKSKANGINSYWFIHRLSQQLTSDHIIVTDMGTSLTCTHAAIEIKDGQRLITSTGLGEMGFGLPGAIGAALGDLNRPVVLIVGEGGFMFNLQEIQTLINLKLNIKIFLLNNNGYLTIRHTHKALFGNNKIAPATGSTSGVTFPNFKKIAKSFDIKFSKISGNKNLDNWIEKILKNKKSVIGEVIMPELQELIPKIIIKMRPDGSFINTPLEDLYPFLTRKQLEEEMLIPLIDDQTS